MLFCNHCNVKERFQNSNIERMKSYLSIHCLSGQNIKLNSYSHVHKLLKVFKTKEIEREKWDAT